MVQLRQSAATVVSALSSATGLRAIFCICTGQNARRDQEWRPCARRSFCWELGVVFATSSGDVAGAGRGPSCWGAARGAVRACGARCGAVGSAFLAFASVWKEAAAEGSVHMNAPTW